MSVWHDRCVNMESQASMCLIMEGSLESGAESESDLESTKIRMSTESAMKPRDPALRRNGIEWLRGPAHQ